MSCKGELTGDSSLELQPSESQASATTTTTTTTTATTEEDNQDSKGCLLQGDGLSQSSVDTQSSGDDFSYAYSHMRDMSKNQFSNSRPSSVPLDQAPDPPGHATQSSQPNLSSPLINPRVCNPCEEYLEPQNQILTVESGTSVSNNYTLPISHETIDSTRLYATITGDEMTDDDYDDVA